MIQPRPLVLPSDLELYACNWSGWLRQKIPTLCETANFIIALSPTASHQPSNGIYLWSRGIQTLGMPMTNFSVKYFFPEISIQGILQEKFYLKTSECYMERVLLAVRGCAASPPSRTGGHKTGEVSSWQSLWLVLGITSEDAKINIICNCILDTLYNWQHSQIVMGAGGLRVPAVREREVCHIQTVHLRASSSSLITSFW